MRKILWLTSAALAALIAIAFWLAAAPAPPLCPTDQSFAPDVNCRCPAGYRFSSTCTKPGLEYWQCLVVKKLRLQCVP